ncbi:MAG: DNA topoisomerase I [Thermoplasmatales archaeon]|nr:DNA topoisomerase I [Thermoplasmatales archaeon]
MMKLVITEKANAARRISTILSDGKTDRTKVGGANVINFVSGGDEYNVVSLRGHILELDYPKEYSDWEAGSPVDLVYAPQVKVVKVRSALDAIAKLAEASDEVIIATDYDREGELIGLETVRAAGVDMSKVKRARFSALTKGEVEAAFANLSPPDEKLSDAAEARQIIDLSWGAVLTRLISLASGQKGKNFMSVGRVQSPTLKLLVDRDEEVRGFVPKPYWEVSCKLGMLAFRADHASNPFWEKGDAERVMARCEAAETATVTSYTVETKEEYRPPPFDTTQMQVEANRIGIPPAAAMKLAEDLYTGGYISYPRTENTEYPKSLGLRSVLERLRDSDFKREAEEILAQDRIVPSRGRRRTTDHPPIYPTAAAKSSNMKGDKWKLYELIVRRFLATLAPNAEAEITECVVDLAGEEFRAEGYAQKKEGWKRYYGKYLRRNDRSVDRLRVGDGVDVRGLSMEGLETKPPWRYNQGSLIQEMDRLNLGTKSTRHDIISKLYSRNYVQGNNMVPTPSGVALVKSLEVHGGGIAEPAMTAQLEDDMALIANGGKTLDEVVGESQAMLHRAATQMERDKKEIGDEIRSALRAQKHIGTCKECGNALSIKRSRNGNFIGCDGYPDCTVTFPMPRGALVETTEETCEECGLPKLRIIRRGVPPQTDCVDPKCPSNVAKTDLGPCPKCGDGRIVMMYSRAGKRFAGCSGWPECDVSYPLRPRGNVTPTGESCEECGAPVIGYGRGKSCIDMKCPSRGKKK